MSESTVDAFFYGLYMDERLLRDKGVQPRIPRKAVMPGHALVIGRRVGLLRRFGAQAFGMVFALTRDELHTLYAGSGLDMYHAEPALVLFENGSAATVCTFNLAEPPDAGERNEDYAKKLAAVLQALKFPADYIRSIG